MISSKVSEIKKIKNLIKKSKRGQILIHTSPDGDAVASATAFYRVIRKLTKRSYHLFCPGPIPQRYRFITHSSQFRSTPIRSSLSIVLDTAGFSRLPGWKPEGVIVNIDHHDSNPGFGDINIIKPESSSTVEILMEIFDAWEVRLDRTTANILYAGLFTETGGFIFRNTKASSLTNAGRLVRVGASPQAISQSVNRQTVGRLRLLGLVLSSLKINNGVAILSVPYLFFTKTHTSIIDTEGFVETPLAIPGVKVSVLLKELKDGRIKVSLRSKGNINVNRIAQKFGGGGHRNAAGVIIDQPLQVVKRRILKGIRS